MTAQARAEFNTWWDRQPFKDQFAYVKQQMENVWLASRAECVVELPKPTLLIHLDAQKFYRQQCLEAITALGLSVFK